jgi:predicted alpha/beta superfamily hydrolase
VSWQPFHGRTVTGDVRVLEGERRLWIYLPPSYEHSDRTYPVLFAHDGQNLFDDDASFAGEWRFDETMEALAAEGVEAIVVGIANSGDNRMTEYSPFTGTGEQYLAYVVDELRPQIGAEFRIASERERTGVIGSSAGGTISLYAIAERPDVFGFAGVLSPAFWWLGERMFEYVAGRDVRGRIYMDIGGQERGVENMHRMAALLREKDVDLQVVEDPPAAHNEAAWSYRLPDALRYLLRET